VRLVRSSANRAPAQATERCTFSTALALSSPPRSRCTRVFQKTGLNAVVFCAGTPGGDYDARCRYTRFVGEPAAAPGTAQPEDRAGGSSHKGPRQEDATRRPASKRVNKKLASHIIIPISPPGQLACPPPAQAVQSVAPLTANRLFFGAAAQIGQAGQKIAPDRWGPTDPPSTHDLEDEPTVSVLWAPTTVENGRPRSGRPTPDRRSCPSGAWDAAPPSDT